MNKQAHDFAKLMTSSEYPSMIALMLNRKSNGDWGAVKSAAYDPVAPLPEEVELYTTCCQFKPDSNGSYKRTNNLFANTSWIVLDDVGTKVSWDKIPPKFITHAIETSVDNYQVWIQLSSPITDRVFASNLSRALTAGGFTDDAAGAYYSRLWRLPNGTNTKPGRNNFRTSLRFSDSNIKNSLEEFISATGLVIKNEVHIEIDDSAYLNEVETVTEDKLLEKLALAVNFEKFKILNSIDLELDSLIRMYPPKPLANGAKTVKLFDHSAADTAFYQMLRFHGATYKQIVSMHHKTALGQREKAYRPDYWLRTLKHADTKLAQEKGALSDVAEAFVMQQRLSVYKPEESKGSEIDFENNIAILPGINFDMIFANALGEVATVLTSLPEAIKPKQKELEWPPGALGEIAKYVYKCSAYPNQDLSILGVLGAAAGIVGHTFQTPTNSGCNLYFLALAKSGVGKEVIHSASAIIKKELKSHDAKDVDRFALSEMPMSRSALIKDLAARKSYTILCNEVGHMFVDFAAENSNQKLSKDIRTALTVQYHKSGQFQESGQMSYSDKLNNVKAEYGLALSFLGESTPDIFETITPSMMSDGFLSRFLPWLNESERPYLNYDTHKYLNEGMDCDVSNYLHEIYKVAQWGIDKPGNYVYVRHSPEVSERMRGFERQCTDKINDLDDESKRQLWTRTVIKVDRLACVLATFDSHDITSPVVKMAHWNWAEEFVLAGIAMFEKKIDDGSIGIDDDARLKKLIELLKDYYKNGAAKGYDILTKMQKEHVIPLRFITTKLNKHKLFKDGLGLKRNIENTLLRAENELELVRLSREKMQTDYGTLTIGYQIPPSILKA